MNTNPNHEICPICNNPMHYVKEKRFMHVMDGNSIYQCSEHPEHKFWVHPFSYKTIHNNPNASITNWDSLMDFKWENDQWVEYKESDSLSPLSKRKIESSIIKKCLNLSML